MTGDISRREWIAVTAGVAACAMVVEAAPKEPTKPFGLCLNTSTIRGQKLSVPDQVELAAKTGYDGIEPWVRELDEFVKAGGSLKDLGKRIKDLGLHVPDAIGFPEWIVDDDERRKKGLDEAKRNMEMVQHLGCSHLAAPPVGYTDRTGLDLLKAAERYRKLLEIGDSMGVTPIVELWGFSKTLHRLGETALVAIESGHPKACVLPDIYHLFKGGSDFEGLKVLRGNAIGIFHINDYPANFDREKIKDADRIYPGDGIAPLKSVLKMLMAMDYRGMLSLELFNPEYWKQDAALVAKTGLEKMKAVVASAMEK